MILPKLVIIKQAILLVDPLLEDSEVNHHVKYQTNRISHNESALMRQLGLLVCSEGFSFFRLFHGRFLRSNDKDKIIFQLILLCGYMSRLLQYSPIIG